MAEPRLHQENLTSCAIDNARISCFLAINLVAMDPELDEARRQLLLHALTQAGAALDFARENFPVIITSLHMAGGGG
jgi:hypothetical protein